MSETRETSAYRFAESVATRPIPGAVFGPFRLLAVERRLLKGDTPVRIGSRALDILIALVERAGSIVPKQELMARVWPDMTVEESSLRVHITGLRKALSDGEGDARYIVNVTGRGYSFVGAVSVPALQGATVGDRPVRKSPAPEHGSKDSRTSMWPSFVLCPNCSRHESAKRPLLSGFMLRQSRQERVKVLAPISVPRRRVVSPLDIRTRGVNAS